MKTCILTVIKNEHLYLDEWIKYHLDLGIDHLFIFEDMDSKSHNSITNKYGNKITLDKAINIVDELKKDETIQCKNRGHSPQNRYIYDGLAYIHDNYNYDWCFVLDCDEYITLENPNKTLTSVLLNFDAYDAIIIQWKNYGANGLVHMPDYNKQGIVDTYTKPCNYADSNINLNKVCYNMRRYNKVNYSTVHQPNKDCKWCKTDLSNDKEKIIYDNIFLRHYITKSWDEYVWKINTRGMFHKCHRNYDSFFIMNEDMLDRKKELIDSINKQKG